MIQDRAIRAGVYYRTWVLVIILAVIPGFARAQQPAVSDWVGKRVIQRNHNFPVRRDGQAVLRSGIEIHIYQVKKMDGDQLWLEGEDDGPTGWGSVDQFVRVDDALPYLAGRILRCPDDVFFYAERAVIHTDRKEPDLAIADWNKIVELEPLGAGSYFGRAKLWLARTEWDKAIDDFTRAIKIDSKYADCYRGRAHAWMAKRTYDLAIADYNQILRLDPDDADSYYDRAWAWKQKGDTARAFEDYAAGVGLALDFEVHRAGADLPAVRAADMSKPVDEFLNTLPLEPAGSNIATKLVAPGDQGNGAVPPSFHPVPAPQENQKNAITDAHASAPSPRPPANSPFSPNTFGIVEPQTAHDFTSRAGDWLSAKMYAKAIADCDEAISLGTRDPLARIYRGLAWCEQKQYDKAIADFVEAIRLDPQNGFAHYARASAWGAKKEFAKADADLGDAVRLDPRNPVACNARAWTWATCPDARYRNGNKAVELATLACELSGWAEAGIIDTLAAAYAEQGDFSAAVNWQNRAIELETDTKNKEDFASRLKLYHAKRPYRDTAP